MVAEVRWLDAEEQATWRAWLAMADLVRAQVARDLLADSGMSEADFTVLVHLSEDPEQLVRMTELADRLRWSRSRLSHQVGRMQARGLVTREECASDARGAFARLTPEGKAEIERAAPAHVASVRRVVLDALDRTQLQQLREIADTVVRRLLEDPTASGGSAGLPPCPRDT
ncbi:MAG: winged helix-turn-helix transcriptional regulator [Acidimicrobiaceae bacterium]|nr:winged helix-turn-helix transcriptional regulator [Acidimicrobiaceae bacterium]